MSKLNLTKRDFAALAIVLAALVALLLPGLSHLRELSRRATCANNLRQLGGAFLSFHTTKKELPPTALWPNRNNVLTLWAPEGERRDTTIAPHANWTILLLPYLGQDQLYAEFKAGVPISDPKNEKLRTTELAVMSCPSDAYHRTNNNYAMVLANGAVSIFARGNYAINMGVSELLGAGGPVGYPHPDGIRYAVEGNVARLWGNGVAGFNKTFSFKDFRNGLATTVLVDEIRSGLLPVDGRGVWAFGAMGACATHAHGLYGDCFGPNPTRQQADDTYGSIRLHQLMTWSEISEAGMTCCDHQDYYHEAGARSMHPGGVQLLTADGATHFARDDINLNLWHLIHSRETPRKVDVRGIDASSSGEDFIAADEDDVFSKPEWTNAVVIDPEVTEDVVTNAVGMKLKRIPTGEYMMGAPSKPYGVEYPDENPPHRVRITKPLFMDIYEVTQEEYEKVVGENPSPQPADRSGEIRTRGEADEKSVSAQRQAVIERKRIRERRSIEESLYDAQLPANSEEEQSIQEKLFREESFVQEVGREKSIESEASGKRKAVLAAAVQKAKADYERASQDAKRFPVVMVSWYDAANFCRKLSELPEEKAAGRRYRLPTEAEWEYACRGGDLSPEDDDPALKLRHDIPLKQVGVATPNAFGLYDMSENVAEWCSDWYLREYYALSPSDDPQGPSLGVMRVTRGSTFVFRGNRCQYMQHAHEPWQKSWQLGFRVACEYVRSQ